MASSSLVPKENLTQTIKFSATDTEFCTEIQGQNVVVHCNEGTHNHGSNKVRLTDRIDYNWEFKYYHGRLIAAHIGGKIIAYGIKGKEGGMIRVANQETNHRALIKNLKEDIKDIAFSFARKEIILGCVDCEGNILIYEIEDTPYSMSFECLMHIFHEVPVSTSKINYRLIWCPYLPSFEEDGETNDESEKMFVVLNSSRAEVYNVAMITDKYGKGRTLDPDESFEGYIEINHSSELVDAAFSSDGTAIAIACSDGYVKFYQLYMLDNIKQKCLHEWQPHGGAPLSSIIFIDNVLEFSSECWKFTVTGANQNSEIKLWSCESWTCLQTITFKSDPKNIIRNLYLNMALDYTGKYLLVTDISNRLLHVMQLKRNDEQQLVCVTLLAQFLLPAPFLSFHILKASSRTVPYSFSNSEEDLYDNDDDEAELTAIFLKMLVIQPKKFQECDIIFLPEQLTRKGVTISESLIEKEEPAEKILELEDLQPSVTLLIQQQQTTTTKMTLMTPDDFTNASKLSRSNSDSSLTKSKEKPAEPPVENLIDFQRPQKENFASAGSSPSREVQEILSLNNSGTNYGTQEYFNNLVNLVDEQEKPQKDFSATDDSLMFQEVNDLVWPKVPVVGDGKDESAELNSSRLKFDYRLTALESSVREQNLLMQQMRQDLKALTQSLSGSAMKSEPQQDFAKELDLAMSQLHLQVAKMFENVINMQKTKERETQDHTIAAVSQILTKTLGEKVEQALQHEVHGMMPVIHKMMDTYRHQMDVQYSQKFANIDVMVRENFTKVMSSKALTESISASVVNSVAPSLEKCYRDIVASSLIPSWEKICGQMFQQINETFTRGTKEYTASVESYMDRQRRVQEKGKDLITQIQTVSESLKGNADRLNSTLSSEINKQFSKTFKSMHERLADTIKETVTEQVRAAFKSHASALEDSVMNAVRSRAVTPSPHADTHVTTINAIQHSLSAHNYDNAFQVALSAENLCYVMFVCERVDINKVFGEECLLQQSSLLALIQQLSMELQQKTELKLSFIRAAFLALSLEDATYKQFVPKVLKELLKQLTAFLSQSPQMKYATDARLLKMAVENMLSK